MPKLMLVAAIVFLAACGGGGQQAPLFAPLDPNLQASVHTIAMPEGALGTTTAMAVRVSITQALDFDARFSYTLQDDTAVAGRDYVDTSGEVTIPAGQLQALIQIDLIGNDVEEATKRLQVNLRSTSKIPLNNDSAWVFISNDDTACVAPSPDAPNRWLEDDRKNLNFAHRGGVIDFPENTLYAYKKVALAGADVLEMDVYETVDGELVILHDLDVDNTTNGTGLVGEKTLAEVKTLDAAYWFVPDQGTPHDAPTSAYAFRGIATGQVAPPPGYTAADFKIPTLEEALQAFPDHLINVELKPDLDGKGNYEAQVADLLRRYGRFDDVIVASFVDEAMNNFKAVAPCFPTSVPLGQAQSLVLPSFGPAPMARAPEHVALQVPPDTNQIQQIPVFIQILSQDLLQDAHAAGLAVHVWTINECEEMLEMLDLGVDAIMTDRPLLLEKVKSQPVGSRSCDGL